MKSSWQILHHIGVIWLKTGVRLKLEPNKTTGDYPLPTAQDVDRVIVYMLDHALVTFDNERVAAFKSFGMVRKG